MRRILSAAVILFALFQPSLSHASPPPEALEQFELSSLKVVSLSPNPEPYRRTAYIQDANGFWHLVKEGSRMGKNRGRISEITAEGVRLVEIVPDRKGGWRESEVFLKPAYRNSNGSQSNNSFKADPLRGRP